MNVPNTVNRFTFDGLNWDLRVVLDRDVCKDFYYEFAFMDIDGLFEVDEMRKHHHDRATRKIYVDFLNEFKSIDLDGLFGEAEIVGTVTHSQIENLYQEDMFKNSGDEIELALEKPKVEMADIVTCSRDLAVEVKMEQNGSEGNFSKMLYSKKK